jgi:hypothetical protein
MKNGDLLYFAPGLRFNHVGFDHGLPKQVKHRLTGFYLKPAEDCCDRDQAFAAGVLIVSCIDAVARLQIGGRVGDRFKCFACRQLPSCRAQGMAHRLYEDFRNGLVHEGRLKNGAQFSLEPSETIEQKGEIFRVNPRLLGRELQEEVDRWTAEVESNSTKLAGLIAAVRSDFADDLRLLGM